MARTLRSMRCMCGSLAQLKPVPRQPPACMSSRTEGVVRALHGPTDSLCPLAPAQLCQHQQPMRGARLVHAATAVQAAPTQSDQSVSLEDVEERIGAFSHEAMVPTAPPVVVVISGPSGVGKDAVVHALKQEQPDLHFVVTATSRAMREGEVHGKDYIFVSRAEFESWVEGDQLLEHAVVYGDYKGIPKQQVADALDQGTDVVMRIDVQGAATIRRLLPHSIFVFLVAESEHALVQRLTQRKTEPMDSMLVRVQTAKEEVKHLKAFDYVVVNREGALAETVHTISSIIATEKASVRRRLAPPGVI